MIEISSIFELALNNSKVFFCSVLFVSPSHQQVVNVGQTMATVAAAVNHVDLVLNLDNINPNVKAMEYAVRGYPFKPVSNLSCKTVKFYFLFVSVDRWSFGLAKLKGSSPT